MKRIILASESPRRKELLEQIGLQFEVEPSRYRERSGPAAEPHELARALSQEKAGAVAARHHDAIVIAADTFIVFQGRILGKPHTEAEARRMLYALSGAGHTVVTAFTIMDAETGKTVTRSVGTKVQVKKLTDAEIDCYVRSGEPLGKAGGYAIQGLGAVMVERIEGDYFNVVGLPLNAVAQALREFGIRVLPGP
ncbi:MAG: septum formation inhibitor Maf [Chloroflexi bacterium]|nr:septum formation inhibitor Maf [Chloroflexota bacterium]